MPAPRLIPGVAIPYSVRAYTLLGMLNDPTSSKSHVLDALAAQPWSAHEQDLAALVVRLNAPDTTTRYLPSDKVQKRQQLARFLETLAAHLPSRLAAEEALLPIMDQACAALSALGLTASVNRLWGRWA